MSRNDSPKGDHSDDWPPFFYGPTDRWVDPGRRLDVPDAESPTPSGPVSGGQGRDSEEVADSGAVIVWMVAAAIFYTVAYSIVRVWLL